MTTSTTVSEKWYNQTWLVILLCLFIFPVGLYALWKSSRISKGWKIAGTATIGLFFIGIISTDSKEATTQKTANESLSKKEDVSNKADALFNSIDDFKNAYNSYTSKANLEFKIGDLKVSEGEVNNTFQQMFTDNLSIIGTVNKSDGSVKEISMLGSGDGTFKSGSNIIFCMLSVIATVDPTLKPEERTDVLKELGFLGENEADIMNMSTKTEKNGIKYFVYSSELTGLMFGASKK